MKPHHVFVSHTNEESVLAQRLKQKLAADFPDQLEFFVSSDSQTILAGDKWLDGLHKALHKAEFVLVLCSEFSVGKPWVNFEAGAGWIRDTRVIPVCHSGMGLESLPVPLNMLQGIEVGRPDCMEKLYRTFSDKLGVKMPAVDFCALAIELSQVAAAIERPAMTGDYRLIDTLKSGELSDVFVALDPALKRTVVKKVLKNPDQAEEFIENARAATCLSSLPHFTSVYSAGFSGTGRPHIIMQHLEKGNLSRHIRKHNEASMDLEYARRVVFRIGDAMYQAHNRSVAIGNLKSTNILLDGNYEPYLSPRTRNTFLKTFELRNAVSKRLVTLEDLAYTAPEVLSRAGTQATPYELSDQYSLGILAYELFTGTLPPTLPLDKNLSDDEKLEVACQLIERRGDAAFIELPELSDLRRDVPDHVSAIFRRMVSLDPEERYPRLDIALGALRTAEQFFVQEARESYVRCLQNASEPGFFSSFYAEFTQHDRIAQRFDAFDKKNWAEQHEKLRSALDASFSFVRNYVPNVEIPEPNALTAVANTHGARGMAITTHEYRHFVDALVATVCGTEKRAPYDPECLDAERRDEIEIAWRELMKPVVRYFRRKSRSTG